MDKNIYILLMLWYIENKNIFFQIKEKETFRGNLSLKNPRWVFNKCYIKGLVKCIKILESGQSKAHHN